MGNGVGISRCQQSMKGILWKIDCQSVANEGEGGDGHKTITESFRGDQLNIIVTKPKSSIIPFISTFISRANTRFRSASPRIWSTLQCDQ